MRRNQNTRRLLVNRLERRDAPTATPIGGEFRSNTFTASFEGHPAVAMDFRGDFVIAWDGDGQDGDGRGIFARRSDFNSVPLSNDIQVNTTTTGSQVHPAIAMDAAGDFVIVWFSDQNGGGIYGQRFDAAGNRQGPEFRANFRNVGNQLIQKVAMDAFGNFVVAWASDNLDANGFDIYARAFDFNGAPRSGEFRVNTFTTGTQGLPDVAMDWAGDFVVAWNSYGQDGNSEGVFAQRYDANAVRQGGEFQVNTFTTSSQDSPSVAMDAVGNFEVAWESIQEGAGNGDGIYSQRYDRTGARVGAETHVNSIIAQGQFEPAAAWSANADQVIAFTDGDQFDDGADGSEGGIFARTGSEPNEFQVNSFADQQQDSPNVAMDANGDFVVVWTGEGPGDADGVFGQFYRESNDTVGPIVTGVYQPFGNRRVGEGQRITEPVSSLAVAFAEDMNQVGGATGANSVTNPANWTLTRDGSTVGNAISSISYAFNIVTRREEATVNFASPLQGNHTYRLTANGNLRDLRNNQLDGNADVTPGDAFNRTFVVVTPAPVGPEHQVNTSSGPLTHVVPGQSAAASAGAGATVVAWRGTNVNPDVGIFAQVYAFNGAPFGPQITVSTTGEGQVAVAIDPDGFFVVAYSRNSGSGGLDVFARRYNDVGAAVGSEFLVNITTTGTQQNVVVAMDAIGDMIFAWETPGQGTNTRVFARRFSPDAAPLGSEIQVDAGPTFNESAPTIAADPAGNFLIVWQGLTSTLDIYARRFSAVGEPQGSDFEVNGFTAGNQFAPAAAMDATGNFVITWESGNQASANSLFDIIARRYDSVGNLLQGDFVVNSFTTGNQEVPSVARRLSGDFVISWESSSQDGSGYGVYTQRYNAAGNRLGSEIRVNTVTADDQRFPAIAADDAGDFVVAWQSFEGVHSNIKAQRFAIDPPRIQTVVVNSTATDPQRSRVTNLRVVMSDLVNFAGNPVSAFVLTRNSDNAAVTFTATIDPAASTTVVTLGNFTGPAAQFGSLADGRYTLTVLASQVSGIGGALDGNADSIGGDNFTFGDSQGLFRFYGDMNGDRRVDISDFGFFSLAFLQPPNFNSALDFNNDGRIDIADFGQFSVRFFTTLP